MSPVRPDPVEACGQAPGEAAREPLKSRATVVSGPAEVEARIDLHLAQCRRRRGVMALLYVSVESITREAGAVTPNLERRVREEVSNRIGNAVRGSDAILRESDRDVCVILSDAASAVATRVSARLERLLGGDYRVAGELMVVDIRVGMAAYPQDGGRAQELLRRAGER
ncbi:MAG: diguanylate cyclase [Betaproteobacteria bacterium]